MLPVGTNLEVSKPPQATLMLIALNIAVFVMEVMSPPDSLQWIFEHLSYNPKNLNPLSILTSLFLHGGFFHLFGNMLYLWLFGGPVEERIGSKLFTYYYFGAGLCSTALYGILEAIVHTDNPIGAIGASGAISGIMALFLYRCYYGKIRMSLPILPTFIFAPWARFSVPAAPLLIYWFLRDFVGGVRGMQESTGVAYWGHVGGFLFGLAVGRIKRYGHEGQLEQAKKKLFEKISQGFGWKTNNAGRELLKLLELSPRDPEIHHQLAHFYVENEQPKKAEEHYQHAVNQYAVSDPVAGAYTVLDYTDVLKKPMGSNHHLRAAEVLAEKGYLDDAYKALRPVMEKGERGVIAERAGLFFIKICKGLDKAEEAARTAAEFLSRHPGSRSIGEVNRVLTLRPDVVFPPRKEPPAARRPQPEEEENRDSALLHVFHAMNRMITDPLFLCLWIFMMSWVGGSIRRATFTFFFSLFITAFFRVDWFYHWSQWGRKSDDEARKEFDITMTYDKAVMAEKGENFSSAAILYEKMLALDPHNIQARFNLARIYLNRLEDKENGIRQLKKLKETAPPDHPYHAFADGELRNITTRFRKGDGLSSIKKE